MFSFLRQAALPRQPILEVAYCVATCGRYIFILVASCKNMEFGAYAKVVKALTGLITLFFCRYYCAAEISWHIKPDEKPFFVVFGRENCNCCIYQAVAIYGTTAVTGNMQRCFL